LPLDEFEMVAQIMVEISDGRLQGAIAEERLHIANVVRVLEHGDGGGGGEGRVKQ